MTRTRHQRLLNQVQRPAVYEEVLLEHDGPPIALSVWRGAEGAPAVVFLAGTMTHPLFYEEFLDRLNREGFHVVGVHFRAHGKSPRTSEPLTFGGLVEDARRALSFALERTGPDVFVLGSSQGSGVALALAGIDNRLRGVLAHNVFDPALPGSSAITRFPRRLAPPPRVLAGALRLAARVAPGLGVPLRAYLDEARITRSAELLEQFYGDPLGRTSYPLSFLASLFAADLSCLGDGRIRCPVTVLASRGDKLFPLEYTRRVFQRIAAPAKDLLVLPFDAHLVLNEHADAAARQVCEALQRQMLFVRFGARGDVALRAPDAPDAPHVAATPVG